MNILKECTFEPFHVGRRNTGGLTFHHRRVPKGNQELTLNYDQLGGFWKPQTCQELMSSTKPCTPCPCLRKEPMRMPAIIYGLGTLLVFINRKKLLEACICTQMCVLIRSSQKRIPGKNNSDKTKVKKFQKMSSLYRERERGKKKRYIRNFF